MNINDNNHQISIVKSPRQQPGSSKRKMMSQRDSVNRGSDEGASSSTQRVCRICLGEEEDDEDGELIYPCKCAGTMRYIHIHCLREWMNGKKLVYNGEKVKSFFWKALECELCKTPFENEMKGRLF
jgi:hypothetical protein